MFKKYVSPQGERQPFIWVGEYKDETIFSEFDLESGAENSFYEIEKEKLKYFGLGGRNHYLFFDCKNGNFNLGGINIKLKYETNQKEYDLTTQNNGDYSDIITFKKAHTDFDPSARQTISAISEYYFGWKKEIDFENIVFNIEMLYCIPMGDKMYFRIRITSNKDIDGNIVLYTNEKTLFESEAPLKENIGGKINIIVN